MCENELCKEKCEVCGQRDFTCCKTQPLMTEEEVAKIHFCTEGVIPDNVTITRVSGGYVIVPKNIKKTKEGININSEYCIFYDREKHNCKIYDMRPKTCIDFGKEKELPCPFTDISLEDFKTKSDEELIPLVDKANNAAMKNQVNYAFNRRDILAMKPLYKIQKVQKNHVKLMREYMLMSTIMHHLNEITAKDTERFDVFHNYKLGLATDGKISSIRLDRIKAKDYRFKVIERLHNFLYNQVLTLPPEFLTSTVAKLNKIISGVQAKDCRTNKDDNALYYVFVASLFRIYLLEYKGKSKKFTDVIKEEDLLEFIKYIADEHDCKDGLFGFKGSIKCVIDNAESIYRAIVKSK